MYRSHDEIANGRAFKLVKRRAFLSASGQRGKIHRRDIDSNETVLAAWAARWAMSARFTKRDYGESRTHAAIREF
jgi:hypothetical protein